MRTLDQWLIEYGDSHRNATNKALHWVCVPVIVWSVMGLLWSLPTPAGWRTFGPGVNWAEIIVAVAIGYYAVLSLRLALGATLSFAVMLWSIVSLDRRAWLPLWAICGGSFVVAWVGQFIGHAIEGKRPSFFKDVQFLMIGPLWLLADAFRRFGIRF